MTPLKRVGHKGADAISPGNTPASFDAALEAGVDMIEFDVLRMRDGRLVMAHDFEVAAAREAVTLEEGLDHLAGDAFAGIEFDVDLKLPGFEAEVIDALRERDLAERSLISSTYPQSLDRVGHLAPGLSRGRLAPGRPESRSARGAPPHPGMRRGLSVPRASRDYTRSALAPAAYAFMRAFRARLPRRAGQMIAAGRFEAVMAHWLLASPQLVSAVHGAGGQVFVWTVDDRRRIARFEAMGVDGVITNDPRLFDPP